LQPSILAKRGSILLFVAFILFYFYGLGQLPFIGPDEPRYAQVAREMFLRRDWITPTLGGYLWFEKPALLYWMAMAAFKLFGASEWAARSASAISGLLTVAAVYWIGRRTERSEAISDLKSEISNQPNLESEISNEAHLNSEISNQPSLKSEISSETHLNAEISNETYLKSEVSKQRNLKSEISSRPYGSLGFWSAFVAGTSGGLIAFSRALSFDILVTMTIAWALAFFFSAELEVDRKSQRRLLAAFYFAMGLSLLAKGLVGFVIPFGVIGAYYTLRGRAPARKILSSIAWGIPLSLAVAAVWYGPMFWKHGILFFDEFIIKHHFERYATNKYHHPGPVYYYLVVLPILALPWSALLIDGLLKARKAFWKGSDDPVSRLQTFTLAWILLPLVFFSFSSSKLPGYILPVLPAVALLAGSRLAQLHRGAKDNLPIITTGALGLIGAIAVLILAKQSGTISVRAALTISAISATAGVLALLLRRRRQAAAILIGTATFAIVVVALQSVAPGIFDAESSRRLIQLADERGYASATVFGLHRDDRSPEFYAAGRVVYGEDHEPVMYDGIRHLVSESHQRRKTVLCLVPVGDLDTLGQAESIQIDVIANNGRTAIVAVTPL
jgi:4-amino-4-deoxy-L-arabinose transferase-like glycosyltransferase